MSRRNRKRRPQAQRPKAEAPKASPPVEEPMALAHLSGDAVRDELRDVFGIVVEEPEKYDPAVGEPALRRLLDGLRRGELTQQEQTELDVSLASAGLIVGAAPDSDATGEEDEGVEGAEVDRTVFDEEESKAEVRDRDTDQLPPEDDFEDFDELPPAVVEMPELERGPLAGGILMMEAMLTEAKAGYIAAQIDVLESAINEEFDLEERSLMADAASQWRDPSGLPDVPAAYQALVVRRATQARPG